MNIRQLETLASIFLKLFQLKPEFVVQEKKHLSARDLMEIPALSIAAATQHLVVMKNLSKLNFFVLLTKCNNGVNYRTVVPSNVLFPSFMNALI